MLETPTNAFVGLLLTTAAATASAQVAGTASGAAEKEVLQMLDAERDGCRRLLTRCFGASRGQTWGQFRLSACLRGDRAVFGRGR
jgi:hypothetical protein